MNSDGKFHRKLCLVENIIVFIYRRNRFGKKEQLPRVYLSVCVILIATAKTSVDSERESKIECGCQLFGTFVQFFWSPPGPWEKSQKFFGFFFRFFRLN